MTPGDNPHKKVYLAFLWHMHQPYYKDDLSGQILMPWVFLHAIKDYYEILWYSEKFPHVKASFNMAPSLVAQIREYESEEVKDRFIQTIRKPTSELSYDEKKFLLLNLFHANPETMVKPLERYHALLLYRNRLSLEEQIDYFGESEMLDLEILFLLAWCGNYLRENNGTVKRLIEKKAHFSEEDKLELLTSLAAFIRTIIPYYRKMAEQGQISVTTTPFFHPILPLLCDMHNGKIANSLTAIPEHVGRDFRTDADLHVGQAVQYHEEAFGSKPTGFWPAEGSVSNEALEILADHGARWACTDEEILFKTLKTGDHKYVYKRYWFHSNGRSLGLLFRDKFLSDRVGFVYAHKSPEDATNDFISHLKNIYQNTEGSVVVPVILDGENAWEHYWENGKYFFEHFYAELGKLSWCECLTMDQVFEWEDVPEDNLYAIEPGSWINGDFGIWLGEPEENLAWKYLHDVKKVYERKKEELDSATIAAVQNEMMIAEGSDWFWWYGDDHYTPIKDEFDSLFRQHLINMYNLMEVEVPSHLIKPVMQKAQSRIKQMQPLNPISPKIDGKHTDFFEWYGSGFWELAQKFSTMSSSGFKLQTLRFGCDDENLYFAIEGDLEEVLANGHDLDIEILYPLSRNFRLPLSSECVSNHGIELCTNDIIEVRFPKSILSPNEDEKVELVFSILKGEELIERAPLYSVVEIDLTPECITEWYI